MQKMTLTFTDERGVRVAIDHAEDDMLAARAEVPMISIRVGFESITLPRAKFAELLRALDMAEKTGVHPDDVSEWLKR